MQAWLRIVSLLILYLSACSLEACNTPSPGKGQIHNSDTLPPAVHPDLPGRFSRQQTLYFDSTELAAFFRRFPVFRSYEKDVRQFYRGRRYAYAWYDEGGLIETADQLSDRIRNLPEEGIPNTIPCSDTLLNLLEESHPGDPPLPALDILLTSAYLSYANMVWKGLPDQDYRQINWLLPRKQLSYRQLLDSLTVSPVLKNEPVYRQYGLLREQLRRLKVLQEQELLPRILAGSRKLRPGDTGRVVTAVRTWLQLMGEDPGPGKGNLFDSLLSQGIRRFQQRMGMKEDGLISRALADEMNVPLKKRMETILVNMERCRWVPPNLQQHFIVVNIPDYRLFVWDADSVVMSMKVVVGQAQHKTVIFTGELRYIVFSPYWNVPLSILHKEILPLIRRNRNYLAANHMEWHGQSVRQLPGPDNALGGVKFLFPNSHSIYLHDTPARSLFDQPSRAFSHGCIRIAEPKKLAAYLLRNNPEWTDSTITAAMHRSSELVVTLSKPTPVYITYFTAWVDRNGRLQLRKDVYGRDQQLARLIMDEKGF